MRFIFNGVLSDPGPVSLPLGRTYRRSGAFQKVYNGLCHRIHGFKGTVHTVFSNMVIGHIEPIAYIAVKTIKFE